MDKTFNAQECQEVMDLISQMITHIKGLQGSDESETLQHFEDREDFFAAKLV